MAREIRDSLAGGTTDLSALSGCRVAISSAAEADALATLLAKVGATVQRFEQASTSEERAVERWLGELVEGTFDDVVFFSAQGVRLVCEMARQLGRETAVIEALRGVRLIAQGGRTARALAEFGLQASLRSSTPGAAALMATLSNADVKGRVVALQPRDPAADADLAASLELAGARVHVAGRALEPDSAARELLERLVVPDLDAIVFFGTAQVAWLWDAALATGRSGALRDGLSGVTVIASESAAEALRDRGVRAHAVPARMLHGPAAFEDIRSLFCASLKHGPVSERATKKRLVILGYGPVARTLCDRLTELDHDGAYRVTVLGEEPLPLFERQPPIRYVDPRARVVPMRPEHRGVRLRLSTRVARIDRERQVVVTAAGDAVPYDVLVLATGSAPFVPPVAGLDKSGVFVCRDSADLGELLRRTNGARSAAILGGGILSFEAAERLNARGLTTHLVEFSERLAPTHLDGPGSSLLMRRLRSLGVVVHVGKAGARISGDERAAGLRFADGSRIEVDMVVVASGVRPRDDLARDADLAVADRGGVIVDTALRTSDPNVFAIGSCAVQRGATHPTSDAGAEMARALAPTLLGAEPGYVPSGGGAVHLRLMGIDVASIGDPNAGTETGRAVVYSDHLLGVYKKVALSDDGSRLLGAVLVGDTAQYAFLAHAARSREPLAVGPEELLFGLRSTSGAPKGEATCSCEGTTRDPSCEAVHAPHPTALQ